MSGPSLLIESTDFVILLQKKDSCRCNDDQDKLYDFMGLFRGAGPTGVKKSVFSIYVAMATTVQIITIPKVRFF